MQKINCKSECKVNILCEGDNVFLTIPETANQLARTFSNTSSPYNYSHNFRILKHGSELVPINFILTNTEKYNELFTMNELKTALSRTRNTSPGQMLKRVPDKMKEYVLKILNKFWMESFCPDCWRGVVIVAFPNPGKDHSKSYNYRLIALTSCISRVME